MRKDSRLSRILHALIHLDMLQRPATSEELGKMLSTNPVVVRRTMALLKEAGYVSSLKGHNGGWSLAVSLTELSLYDIHTLVAESAIFTIGLTDEHNNCPIEKAVNAALNSVLTDAEAMLLKRFRQISIGSLAENFKAQRDTPQADSNL